MDIKDRQYWIKRGSHGRKYVGYVCIGHGDEINLLVDQILLPQEDLYYEFEDRLVGNNKGNEETGFYYLTNDKFNELFPEDPNLMFKEDNMDDQASETTISLPLSFFKKVIDGLQIGFENTEEVFILNGQRNTRSDRMNAARLENEMLAINNLITELKTFL